MLSAAIYSSKTEAGSPLRGILKVCCPTDEAVWEQNGAVLREFLYPFGTSGSPPRFPLTNRSTSYLVLTCTWWPLPQGKTKRDEFGRAAMNFEDLVKAKYPYTTAQDMVAVNEAVAKGLQRAQIRVELSKRAVRRATKVFNERMDLEGTGCSEVDFETLESGLMEEYSDLQSAFLLLKSMDSDVHERLRNGGTMTKNVSEISATSAGAPHLIIKLYSSI